MERSLHEIFTDVAEETSINKKVDILKDNDSQGLQVFLRCVFDDKILIFNNLWQFIKISFIIYI